MEATYEDALRVAERLSKTDQRRLAQRLLYETKKSCLKSVSASWNLKDSARKSGKESIPTPTSQG